MIAAPVGVPIQQITIFPNPFKLIWAFRMPIPKMAPTTACEVETGSLRIVMMVTVTAAATDEITACPRPKVVNPLRVSIPGCPDRIAPIMTKTDARTAAVQNLSILEETAVPKTLAPSFAPRDHPKNIPPKR